MAMVQQTVGRLRREARLTVLPVTWAGKYPNFHFGRWIVVGTIVAFLTGNVPLARLNPFGEDGLRGVQSEIGRTMTSIVAYPLPLTISVTRWLGDQSNRLCSLIELSCDIDPARNLRLRVRNPVVRANDDNSDTPRAGERRGEAREQSEGVTAGRIRRSSDAEGEPRASPSASN